jgi:secretion/DNA translocation related TadE-like protein
VTRVPPGEGSVRMQPGAPSPSRGATGSCRDRGSATVAVVGVVGVLLAMTVGGLMVISAVVASHRAHSAADLAALGAAAALVRGEPALTACAFAGAVASRNGAGLVTCQSQPDLSVTIEVRVPATMSHVGLASARSRAGPSP